MAQDKEKMFEFLDGLRYKGEPDYVKRELLAIEFRLGTNTANKLLEEYNEDIPNRRQFLHEGTGG